jgi:hypothetical protein
MNTTTHGLIEDIVKSTDDATSFLERLTDEGLGTCDANRRTRLIQSLARNIRAILRFETVKAEVQKAMQKTPEPKPQ